jgi:carbonic anhydrase/acetyltransferase-like protein (isoleucine patch superfamily)
MQAPSPLLPGYRGIRPTIADDTWIAPNAVVTGDTEIGAQSSIWFGCILRGDVSPIRVGARVNIQDGTIVHVSSKGISTLIGDDVSIGHMALIHACTLESGSFVGMGAVVMDGTLVETGAMVAAGALVTPGKVVRTGQLWAGRPAQFMRALNEADYETFRYTVREYVELGQQYRADSLTS